ncbi:hypothetical protein JG559_00450 [Enterococcus faecalis]|uniref:Uncharacterized protein n=1 Tax=Enterococcus faecalis TaxID=1351 RepID=A0A974NZM5_ENTFL|nr:hypothetical protein JG559_00450 [Enterococcus faecalis]
MANQSRPWTVNRMEEMENCFQLKLAGVHTDFPEEAKICSSKIGKKKEKHNWRKY